MLKNLMSFTRWSLLEDMFKENENWRNGLIAAAKTVNAYCL